MVIFRVAILGLNPLSISPVMKWLPIWNANQDFVNPDVVMVNTMKWKSVRGSYTAIMISANAKMDICGNQTWKILVTLLQENVFLYLKNVGMVLKKVMKNVMMAMETT